jgi:ABC-type uncharacterized transport system permease subunit
MVEFFAIYRFVLAAVYLAAAAAYGMVFADPRPRRGKFSTVMLVAAVVMHVAYLWITFASGSRPPFESVFQVLGLQALALSLAYLHVEFRMREKTTGVFITFVAAVFMVISAFFTDPDPTLKAEVLDTKFLILHVAPVIVAYAGFTAAFIYSALFLMLHHNLKKNRFGIIFDRFPPLETLGDMNYKSIQYGMVFLTLGVIAGAVFSFNIFNLKNLGDVKILFVLAGWVVFGIALLARKLGGLSYKRMAYVSLVGFAVLIISMLIINPLLSTYHKFN